MPKPVTSIDSMFSAARILAFDVSAAWDGPAGATVEALAIIEAADAGSENACPEALMALAVLYREGHPVRRRAEEIAGASALRFGEGLGVAVSGVA